MLVSDKPLNILYLGNIFERISGVNYAEPDKAIGDGNYIKAQIESSYIKYIFSIGWGDCPAGCIHRHFWEYTVSYKGEVKYLGSYGDKIEFQPK